MARASTHTLLSLDQFAKTLGINPFEFNQIGKGLPTPITAQCASVWFQHQWQQDWVSREEIADAIDAAERLIANQINFYAAPRYITNELVEPRKRYDKTYSSQIRPDGSWKPITTQYLYVREAGKLARTLLDIDAAVTAEDFDGDGFDESFSLTFTDAAISGLTADQIGIYFTEADRLNNAIDETWRIRPLKISVSGTTLTVRGSIALLVLPNLQEMYAAAVLTYDPAIFATTLEIYKVYTDTTASADLPNHGLASWDPPPGCDEPDCSVKTSYVCLANENADAGVVKVQIPSCAPYSRNPDRLHINYLAGLPLENGLVNSIWAKAIAYLAVALLPSDKCGCERSNAILHYWRLFPSSDSNDSRPMTIREIEENPFGNERRGSLFAWKFIKDEMADGILG